MRIAVIGANGVAGKRIVREALERGHDVRAIMRKPVEYAQQRAEVLVKDLFDLSYEDIQDCSVIISAVGFWAPSAAPLHVAALKHLAGVLAGRENRLLFVGCAGSLYADPACGKRLMDTPAFPSLFRSLARSMSRAIDDMKQCMDVSWTCISPAICFSPWGKRCGYYRTGDETVPYNDEGESFISYDDYAIAVIDEAEAGRHIRENFSVFSDNLWVEETDG